jgi:hypothetical protein
MPEELESKDWVADAMSAAGVLLAVEAAGEPPIAGTADFDWPLAELLELELLELELPRSVDSV